jgi:hypothetical protein
LPAEELKYSVLTELLPSVREKWEAGDALALIDALFWCVLAGLPLPDWCSSLIKRASQNLYGLEVKTLDEAFDIKGEINKGVNLVAARKKLNFTGLVWVTVNRLRATGLSYEDALEAATKELARPGFVPSVATVKRMYSEGKDFYSCR